MNTCTSHLQPKNQTKNRTPLSRKRGYTLLFAVLTAALVLGVAVFIIDITRKQYLLAASASNSAYAFYAADSGIECVAASTITSPAASSTSGSRNLSCGNTPQSVPSFSPSQPGTESLPSIFTGTPTTVYQYPPSANPPNYIPFVFRDSNGYITGCARVKFWSGYLSTGSAILVVDSRGYNLCNSSGVPLANSETVERGLEMTRQ